MGKNFWPLFIIAAALGAAAIWTQTPRYVTALPEGLRAAFRSYVRQAQGLGSLGEQVAAQTEEKNKPVQLLGGTTAPATDAPATGTVPTTPPTGTVPLPQGSVPPSQSGTVPLP